MMMPAKVLLLVLSVCLSAVVEARDIDGPMDKREALNMGLYPPKIIMRHHKRLGITGAQRSQIIGAVEKFQSEVEDLHLSIQSEQQRLRQSFAGYTIKTDESLAQAAKVLALESRFKLAHFRLLITIKNLLSKEQVDLMNREIKRNRDARGGADVA